MKHGIHTTSLRASNPGREGHIKIKYELVYFSILLVREVDDRRTSEKRLIQCKTFV